MNFALKSSIVILLFGFLCIGCSEDPASVGSDLYPKGEKFTARDTSVAAIHDTTFIAPSPNGYGVNVLVGNHSSVDAKALLHFSNTIPESLTTVQIDTAILSLTVSYTWNLSSTPAEYLIREVTTPWSAATVTTDSLASLNIVPTQSSPFVNTDTIATGKVMTALVDTTLIRKWITVSHDTSKSPFFSLALVTKPGLTNTGIWGFSKLTTVSYSAAPSLKIIYSKNGKKDSVELNIGEDTFLATRNPFVSSGYIETQGGISVRSKINFDLKPIADSANRAIVNLAIMELTINSGASVLGAGTPDSVLAMIGGSDARPDSVSSLFYAFGHRKDDSVYTFTVTTIAQQWINNPSKYQGVVIRSYTDESSVDKLAFYPSTNALKAPRLFITYTKK